MGVVAVNDTESVVMGRQLYWPLMRRLAAASDLPEDVFKAEQAEALDGLHFDLMPAPQAVRVARRLLAVADEMRSESLRDDPADQTRRAELLGELSMYLAGFVADTRTDHPALRLLLGAYLDLDWADEYGTPWNAVDGFVAGEPSAAELPGEIDDVLAAGHDEAGLRAIVLDDMGTGYLPREGDSIASWLADVARHVRGKLDARP